MNQIILYEVNTRQYTTEGTFRSFITHLPRLKNLGVTVLWFMPIHPIGIRNRKGNLGSYYSIRDYKNINPEFGNNDDFKGLINTAHQLGIKIIIDWVANHTAWDHIWTISHPEYFVRDADGNFKSPHDWDDVIQIDHTSEAQQKAMIDAMQYWIEEFDIDGFRADLAHLTPLPFWKKARHTLDKLKPGLIWLAETEEPHYHEAFDISYTWKWMHACEEYVKKEKSFSDLLDCLHDYETGFPVNVGRLFFTTNHDENSWNGTEYEKFGKFAEALAVFSFLYKGIPLIYSGQEIPLHKRLKFFDKDAIQWETSEGKLHKFYKQLSSLHVNNAPVSFLTTGSENNIMAFTRPHLDADMLVLINLGDNKYEGTIAWSKNVYLKDVFTIQSFAIHNNEFKVDMDPGGYLVLLSK